MAFDGRILSKVMVQIAMSVGWFLTVSKRFWLFSVTFFSLPTITNFQAFLEKLFLSLLMPLVLSSLLWRMDVFFTIVSLGQTLSQTVLDVLLTLTSVGVLDSLPRGGWGGTSTNIVRSTRCSLSCYCFFSLSIRCKVCLALKIITRGYTA